jgi:hypothetical protein
MYFVFWHVILNIQSTLTKNVFDNNIQYMIYFSAPIVFTNCTWFIILKGSV